jgi:hypothetical protein
MFIFAEDEGFCGLRAVGGSKKIVFVDFGAWDCKALFGCRRQGTVGPYKVRLVSAATWSHTSLLVLGCVGSTSIYVSGILLFLSH